jgi:hypothetical protein
MIVTAFNSSAGKIETLLLGLLKISVANIGYSLAEFESISLLWRYAIQYEVFLNNVYGCTIALLRSRI